MAYYTHSGRFEPRDPRDSVIFAAERIRAQHDPADWPLLHYGPITYERAVEILEWWHGRNVASYGFSSLDLHMPRGPQL